MKTLKEHFFNSLYIGVVTSRPVAFQLRIPPWVACKIPVLHNITFHVEQRNPSRRALLSLWAEESCGLPCVALTGFSPCVPSAKDDDRSSSGAKSIPPVDFRLICKFQKTQIFLNQVAPQSAWPNRFKQLLVTYPEIPKPSMGIPNNWEECPIWKQ